MHRFLCCQLVPVVSEIPPRLPRVNEIYDERERGKTDNLPEQESGDGEAEYLEGHEAGS